MKVLTFGDLKASIPSTVSGLTSATDVKMVIHPIEHALAVQDYDTAAREMRKLAVNYVRTATSTVVRTTKNEWGINKIIASTIGLSNELLPNQIAFDGFDRIIINAEFGLSRDIDCDGDPAIAYIFNDQINGVTVKRAMLEKQPPTSLFPILDVVDLPLPVFSAIDENDIALAQSTRCKGTDFDKAMVKTYSPQPISICTSRWWSYMLWLANNGMQRHPEIDIVEATTRILNGYAVDYRNDLEGNIMKGARKGDGAVRPQIFDIPIFPMTPLTSAIYGSRGSTNATDVTSMDTILETIRTPKFAGFEPSIYKEKETAIDLWTRKDQVGDLNIPDWLIQGGYMKAVEIPSSKAGMPPAVMLTLIHKGEDASLVWTKGTGEKVIGYCCILYPVFAYNPQSKVLEVMHPLKHMALWLSRHFRSGEIYSQSYIQKIFEGGAVHALESTINKYVQLFGDSLLSTVKNGVKESHKISRYFGSHTIVVDHTSNPSWDGSVDIMMRFAKICNNKFVHIHLPSVSSQYGVRKHFYADEDGLPSFVIRKVGYKSCQDHRPGRNRALLSRSNICVTFRCAIVANGPSIQYYITPSGIAKSNTELETFLPEISYEEKPGFELTQSVSWGGSVRYHYVCANSRKPKVIGKFTCVNGQRFEPRYLDQCTSSDGQNIDLIIPSKELLGKEMLDLMMSFGTKQIINTPSGAVEAYVLDWRFFRSGTASENISARYPQSRALAGFIGLIFAGSLNQVGLPYSRYDQNRMDQAAQLLHMANNMHVVAQHQAEALASSAPSEEPTVD